MRKNSSHDEYEYFQLFDPDDEDSEVENGNKVFNKQRTQSQKSVKSSYQQQQQQQQPTCPLAKCLSPKQIIIAMGALLIVVLSLALGLGFGLAAHPMQPGDQDKLTHNKTKITITNEKSPASSSESVLGTFVNSAVAIDGQPCAEIGAAVLRRNGTAVDSAIAALFCNGVYNPHSMGIGGGFLMTIYINSTGEAISLNARETAPEGTTLNMFEGDSNKSQNGPLAAGVPGEIRGYWEAKARYGNPEVSWKSLIVPTIEMCRNGIPVSPTLVKAMDEQKERILKDPGLREIFVNPATNKVWSLNENFKWENFARTLERIADNGVEEFYSGETAKKLLEDLQRDGGIITQKDLASYNVSWTEALKTEINDHMLYTVPPPGSGSILAYILNILQFFKLSEEDANTPLLYHRMAEAFKWAYAVRSRLGDPFDKNITEEVNQLVKNMTSKDWGLAAFNKISDDFTVNNFSYYGGEFVMPEDHGTAHVSVLAPNGDAVSATSTVNLYFGGRYMSPSTGIILNNEMDDFSYPGFKNYFGLPPSPANFAKPGKRPLSSMSPAIVTDSQGNVQIIVGAAGGTKITTAVAQTILRNLWLNQSIKESIDARRIHHQLMPMVLKYEDGITSEVQDFLTSRGHQLEKFDVGGSVVCGIARDENGTVTANSDFRKTGGVAGD